ncbi:hypothetical protein MGWOODY_Tha2518 [hydrothermal vent metagenome]|uniref:Uncharacterized protein n=1 Tax=hydrothermal vent metagenome TaxID=652676 RepID=A0A160TGE3_9ZZZZ
MDDINQTPAGDFKTGALLVTELLDCSGMTAELASVDSLEQAMIAAVIIPMVNNLEINICAPSYLVIILAVFLKRKPL